MEVEHRREGGSERREGEGDWTNIDCRNFEEPETFYGMKNNNHNMDSQR